MATNTEGPTALLKHVFQNITTSSTNARKEMLSELQPYIGKQDFPEAGIKLLCRILPNTIYCYLDSGSRRAVEEILRSLLNHHREATLTQLVDGLSAFGKHQRSINHSKSSGGAALVGLHWTCVIVHSAFNEAAQRKGKLWERLVEIQCDLSSAVLACGRPSIVMSAYHRLRRIWREVPDALSSYATTLSSLDHDQHKMCLIAFLMQYCSHNQCIEAVSQYKSTFIEAYVKGVFGGKIKPLEHVLVCSRWLLCHVTHEEFKKSILPAVQKSMLRSPENIMQAYRYLLVGLSLDLSQYAKDLAKNIATQLHAKDDTSREEAIIASRNLANQCSDADTVEEVAKHFFSVLNGSEGKLTVVTQRLAVLSGIGNLSYNTVSGSNSVQQVTNSVVTQFIPFLQQEVHEGTLTHTLTMLSLWCNKLSTDVPSKLVEWFKKGMGLKQSTSAVRNAYLQCMLAAFNGDTISKGLDLLPILKQSLEKAKAQANLVAVVTEGLSASCLMVRMAGVDTGSESRFSFLWGTILNAEKQLFTSEKFLTSASEEALGDLQALAEKLLVDHPDKFKPGTERPFHRALVMASLHPSWNLRKKTNQTIKKLLAGPGSQQMAIVLVEELCSVLSTQKVSDPLHSDSDVDGSGDASSNRIAPKIFALSLQNIMMSVGVGLSDEHKTKLVLDTFLDAHHPIIVEAKPSLWVDVVDKFQLDLKKLVSENLKHLLEVITKNDPASKARLVAARTLVREEPQDLMPALIDHVMHSLNNSSLQTVTVEEYKIMQTPEGELYDKSVVASNKDPGLDIGHMKRESKAYSYKDQLMEIELKKEIEAKKRAKGIKIEVKLTKKQQEAKDAQLAKESAIRNRLKKMDMELANALSLIQACIDGNSSAVKKHIPVILPTIMPLLLSPLAAPYATEILLAFRSCVFSKEEQILASSIAYCTLRLYKPACPIDPEWCNLDLITMASKAVQHIHSGGNTDWEDVDSNDSEFANKTVSSASLFSAPAFAYFFPMLRKILHNGGAIVKNEEEVVEQALNIICEHAKLKSEDEIEDENNIDESGPELLPRQGMLELLVHLISISGPVVQMIATTALVDLCTSASGGEGCTIAQQEEIDVLLGAMQSSCTEVRSAGLKGLHELLIVLPYPDTDRENGLNLLRRIWLAQHDAEENITALATQVWDDGTFETDPELCNLLLEDVIHHVAIIRESAAEALAAILEKYPKQVEAVMTKLFDMYQDKLVIAPPVLDQLGRMVSDSPPDDYSARCGIATALGKISPLLKPNDVTSLFKFFVPVGLGDRHGEVRKAMLEAARMTIETHGKDNVNKLLPVFEKFLDEAPDSSSYDAVRQSVVILIGSLAKHLDKSDPKVKPIVGKLIEALSTPSQQVQEAVANCLPPLVPAIKADAPTIVKRLLALLLESENFGERKGAAYGLAGLVKGLGILSLKQLDIMTTLQEAIQNKKNFRHREGALFAFEMLCSMLGRLFEPYVVHVLPHLLLCFGDNNQYVREATDDTSRAVMSKLSGHGVKLVLPSLLAALEEDSWRTKAGSVELLGAMAFCAPKQLSSCLPSIVPKLMEVLTDSHVKVQKAGLQALKQIGSVIRNPEIQAIVDILLDALSNPFQKTSKCLGVLLNTKFVHFIDAPSLALIMPVVQRAFQDRSTETKKMSAQIIGNMYSLTDQKDLAPYLPAVMPGLKASLLDPVPEVRKVSARALGAMVKGMGESSFDDLLPWLMEKLTSEQNSVDRSGAAQGLSEVVAGMGMAKLDKLMPDIVKTAEAPDIPPHVRDGYIMMFIYLPGTFGDKFQKYVGQVIPATLKALADESEFVRDTALRAGQRIVNMYADTAISIFLPELENGLFDDNWRIRYSSVQLLGDLLYRISGVSGKMTTVGHEDDNFGTETSTKALIKVLGPERRNRVLAGLYMGRSDTALMVRQAALHVWKVVVFNTPKTLKEIMSTLFGLLLGCLASTSYDKRQVAARTLGDLVRKLGDRVLPEIIPILQKGLLSEQSEQRQGVCVGLSEIMESTSREQVLAYIGSVVPTVQRALCDPLPEVREAAAKTFDNLHSTIGHRALEDILPKLLNQLDDPVNGEHALDGLKQVMVVKSRVVMPFLVPKLTQTPVNTKVLAILSEVAGDALTKHLGKILQALMSALKDSICTEREAQELEYCQTVVLSVTDEQGLYTIMDELLPATRNKHPGMRRAAVTFLYVYCSQTKTDYSQFVPQLLRSLIQLFADEDDTVVSVAWDALSAVTKKLTPAEQMAQISSLRQAISYATDSMQTQELPGFCLPKKGITPILPIFREGILNGAPDMKEQAAVGLGEVIKLTSTAALKSQVVNITGPLIRVLGDRYAWNVKVAILQTLGLLLAKVGVLLKAFLPQLQTTFLRALSDPNRSVRLEAALALAKLVVIHARVDPLFTELHNGVKNTEADIGVRETMLQALRGVISGAGQKMGAPVRKTLVATLTSLLGMPEDTARMSVAGCLGALFAFMPDEDITEILIEHILVSDPSQSWMLQHGRSVALAVSINEAPERLVDQDGRPDLLEPLVKTFSNDRVPICVAAVRGLGFFAKHCVSTGKPIPPQIVSCLTKSLNHNSNEVKMTAAQMISYIAMATDNTLDTSFLKSIVVVLVSNTKDKNTAVQADSELALVSLMALRQGQERYQVISKSLDAVPAANLSDCMKRLNKVASQPEPNIVVDDTILR